MKVIFLKNIKGTAQIGDIKEVSSGHARNFLFPNKIAKPATTNVQKESEALKQKRTIHDTRLKSEAEEIVKRLKDVTLEIKSDANTEGHLYGSVGEKEITEALKKHYKIALERSQIDLPAHIKSTGEHQVKLKLYTPAKGGDQTIATTLIVRVLPS